MKHYEDFLKEITHLEFTTKEENLVNSTTLQEMVNNAMRDPRLQHSNDLLKRRSVLALNYTLEEYQNRLSRMQSLALQDIVQMDANQKKCIVIFWETNVLKRVDAMLKLLVEERGEPATLFDLFSAHRLTPSDLFNKLKPIMTLNEAPGIITEDFLLDINEIIVDIKAGYAFGFVDQMKGQLHGMGSDQLAIPTASDADGNASPFKGYVEVIGCPDEFYEAMKVKIPSAYQGSFNALIRGKKISDYVVFNGEAGQLAHAFHLLDQYNMLNKKNLVELGQWLQDNFRIIEKGEHRRIKNVKDYLNGHRSCKWPVISIQNMKISSL